jgi:hypothetical protein
MLLDREAAWKGIQAEWNHYARGHLGQTGSSFTWYLNYLWIVNPFYLILGIPGIALSIWRERRAALPWAAFALVYFWLIGRQAVHFGRNALPVMVLLMVGVGTTVEAVVAWLSEKMHGRKLCLCRWRLAPASVAAAILALVPLIPSLISLPPLISPPRPSGKALAQSWFDEQLDTHAGRRYIRRDGDRALRFVGEAYTVYLNPAQVNAEYFTSMTHIRRDNGEQVIRGPQDLIDQGYDVALLGTGMFRRFYDNPDVFADQVRLYDTLLGANAGGIVQSDDVLAFRGDGLQVYVVFLSERAQEFAQAVRGG